MTVRLSRGHALTSALREGLASCSGAVYDMGLMKETLATSPNAVSPASRTAFRTPLLLAFLSFGVVWFGVIRHLRSEWSFNPQYSYGWSVPFLALFLLWKRWLNRPAPAPGSARIGPVLIILAGVLLLTPVRFLSGANPDWRLLSWAGTGLAIGVSISLIHLAGGKPWVRHFAFPLLFVFVAVPWPVQFEQLVTQTLMRAVTAINVFGLNLAGVPALQHGNVIEVGSGLIGIEEACSGVRSLQATFMISIFLGELYSFSWRRRLVLPIAGAVLAFFCNLVRTAFLVWIGTQQGAAAIHAWHDPAGLTILLFCLFGLWLISLWMRRGAGEEPWPQGLHPTGRGLSFPPALLAGMAAWLVLTEAGVQAWYYEHRSPLENSRWNVHWPTAQDDYKPVAISPEAESLLRYNEGGGGTWKAPDGRPWLMYFFRWLPGRTAALFVKTHRPDICLPASGMTMVSDNGIRLLDVNGVKLPIRSYRFNARGTALHVFYCYWDARSSYESTEAANEEDWTAQGRIRAALRGRREIGAQMLELAVWGYENDAEAEAALQHQMEQVIGAGAG